MRESRIRETEHRRGKTDANGGTPYISFEPRRCDTSHLTAAVSSKLIVLLMNQKDYEPVFDTTHVRVEIQPARDFAPYDRSGAKLPDPAGGSGAKLPDPAGGSYGSNKWY